MVPRAIALFAATWCACIVVGFVKMLDYELTPARPALTAAAWPIESQIQRDDSRPTLVLFLHPQCPCSRSTLRDFSLLEADCGDRFAARIVFVRPAGASDSWKTTDQCRAAEATKAIVSSDIDGAEASRFGATTSGQVLLYAAEGRLLFHGGITASRGHEGGNVGRTSLTALINSGRATVTQTPVFGCSLISRSEATQGEDR